MNQETTEQQEEQKPVKAWASEFNDLLPCPFCGGTGLHVVDAGYNHYAVRCRNDGCQGQGKRDHDRANAIKAWNMRAI